MLHDIRKDHYPAYMTVYLALTMTVLLSLFLTLLEGARSNCIRMETECVTDIGLNSLLAEYHRELLRQYNLFAIDSSYGTALPALENTTQHLQEYLERNFSMEDVFLSDFIYRDFLAISVSSIEMTGVSVLTDGEGAVFRKRTAEAVKDDCNLTLWQEVQQWLQVVEDNGLRDRNIAEEKKAIDQQIQDYDGRKEQISEMETSTVQIPEPTASLEEIRKKGILQFVIEDTDSLSLKTLQSGELIAERMAQGRVNSGNISVSGFPEEEQLLERFFFQEYLLRYMGHYGAENEEDALRYQIEYLLTGKDGDTESLKSVANIICAIREAANAIYIFSDAEKCSQAELVATVIASLLQLPELASLLKTSLLLGWAYAESLYDVKVLLAGGRVPLMKDGSSWHYDLQSAMQITKGGEENGNDSGLSYEDYLRILMMFTGLDTLTGRAMNMVEADIRQTPGNAFFRLDGCYDQVEFCIQVNSAYGYQYEIVRRKGYE